MTRYNTGFFRNIQSSPKGPKKSSSPVKSSSPTGGLQHPYSKIQKCKLNL